MRSWMDVRIELEAALAGTEVTLARESMAHPRDAGAVRRIGWPRGQVADWRFPPTPTCRGLHVHEFGDRWVAHLDRVHPDCDLLGHLQHDAPQVLVGGTLLAGGLLGVLVDRPGRGFTVGTLAGALFGWALVAARAP